MSYPPILGLTIAGLSLGLSLSGCSVLQQNQPPAPAPNAPSPSTTAANPTASKTATSAPSANSPNPENAAKTGSSSPSTPVPSAVTSAPSAVSKVPLTIEKLKNAEYYFLAQGAIKLSNGKYEDSVTKREYVLDEVVTYGDLNQDGIKDAVGSLKVSIPNSGDFSYLVTVLNENGKPKNIAAEFLGARVKVKTITIKPDGAIAVAISQYRPGDPACCPSIDISRTYKLRTKQPVSPVQSPTKP